MNKTSPLVIALLVSSTSAVQHRFRPTAGSVPWGGSATRPTWDTPDYPVNYFIPNLGADHNILTTMNSLKIAENGAKKSIKAAFAQHDNTDLRTPNLGQDEDVKFALASINESQKETGKQLVGVTFGQQPVQYAQSKGPDSEIADSISNINLAEKRLNHKLSQEANDNSEVRYNQNYQQLGLDADMQMSQANIAESEKIYGQFVPVQDYDGVWRVGKDQLLNLNAEIHLESDPICNSAGCTQYKHPESVDPDNNYPINYAVPNFGQDRQISDSIINAKVAEGIVKHTWTWKDKKKPVTPPYPGAERGLDVDMVNSIDNMQQVEKRQGGWSLVQLGSEQMPHSLTQIQSDPICSSGGCTQYTHGAHKAPRGYDIDYPVPNLGMDVDIKASLANLPVAEKIVGDKWAPMGTPESIAKYSNPAKKTMYNFAPELDGNVKDSIKNLSDSETNLKHKYSLSLVQLQSDPICSSAGCGQYSHPASKEVTYPQDYGVPHYGMDRDIMGSLDNLKVAEKVVGKTWTGIDGAKYSNPAKKVMYNYAPKLDGDIIDSKANLAATEGVLKHEYSLS